MNPKLKKAILWLGKEISSGFLNYWIATSALTGTLVVIIASFWHRLSNTAIDIWRLSASRWTWKEATIVLDIAITSCIFFFLLGKLTKNKIHEQPTINPTQMIKKEETSIPKREPIKSVQWEKFHTFDEITFKFHSGNGGVFDDYFCSHHHVPMIVNLKAEHRYWNFVYLKCPLCKEHLDMEADKLKNIRYVFKLIAISFAKGDLKELPTRSDL